MRNRITAGTIGLLMALTGLTAAPAEADQASVPMCRDFGRRGAIDVCGQIAFNEIAGCPEGADKKPTRWDMTKIALFVKHGAGLLDDDLPIYNVDVRLWKLNKKGENVRLVYKRSDVDVHKDKDGTVDKVWKSDKKAVIPQRYGWLRITGILAVDGESDSHFKVAGYVGPFHQGCLV